MMTKMDIEDILMKRVGEDTTFEVIVEDWQACITLKDHDTELSRLISFPTEEDVIYLVDEFNEQVGGT